MIQKTEYCQYCDKKMESITAKKKFCSTVCRVYFNREKKIEKILNNSKNERSKLLSDQLTFGVSITKTENKEIKRIHPLSKEGNLVLGKIEEKEHPKYLPTDPREGSAGFYLKYGVFTYDEI